MMHWKMECLLREEEGENVFFAKEFEAHRLQGSVKVVENCGRQSNPPAPLQKSHKITFCTSTKVNYTKQLPKIHYYSVQKPFIKLSAIAKKKTSNMQEFVCIK